MNPINNEFDNTIATIAAERQKATSILEIKKKRFIERLEYLTNKGRFTHEELQKALNSIQENNNRIIGSFSKSHLYYRAEQAYDYALEEFKFWETEAASVEGFLTKRKQLGDLLNDNKIHSQKTRRAVGELINYIDQQNEVEPSLSSMLRKKNSWATLHGALDKTCVLLERPYALDEDALGDYTCYSNGVDGKPLEPTSAGGYEFLFPALPLILGVKFLLTGLSIGFLAGGILCPALSMTLCLLASVVALYLVVQIFTHTGLSRKMLDIAHAEREFAENPHRASLIEEYNTKKNELSNDKTRAIICHSAP